MRPTDASKLARRVLNRYGLSDWGVAWNHQLKIAGMCHYDRRLIVFSLPIVEMNERYLVEELIIHEAAHALTEGHCHDKIWEAAVEAMGGVAERAIPVMVPGKSDWRDPRRYRRPPRLQLLRLTAN